MRWLKQRISRVHLEVRRGSRKQAILYCLKSLETTPTSSESSSELCNDTNALTLSTGEDSISTGVHLYGWQGTPEELISSLKPTKQTQKERLQQLKKKIDDGQNEIDIINEDFEIWVKYNRSLRLYKTLITPKRNHEVEVIVIQGPTGTGKSKYAQDNYPDAYWKQRSIWWDGYENDETVVIDEFYGWIPYDTLLRICDRYPLLVETKGGQIQFTAKRIIITSNSVPNNWYKNVYFDSFVRRVSKWLVFPQWGERQSYTDYSQAISKFVNNV